MNKLIVPRPLVVTSRALKQVTRDRRTFGMIILVPIVAMIIFGFAVGGEVKDAPIAVIINDRADPNSGIPVLLSVLLLNKLQEDSRLKVSEKESFSQAKKEVDHGKLNGAIHFPENFTNAMIFNETFNASTVELYVDSTIPQTQAAIMGALREAQLQVLKEISESPFVEVPIDPDKLLYEIDYANNGKDFSGLDVAVPAVVAFIINFLILLLTTLLFVRERSYGTRDRLMITPLKPQEHVAGYTLAGLVLALVEAVVILTISIAFFGAEVRGNFALLFIAIILYGTTFVCLGAFLSNFARNELQAVQMGPLVALPSMALSGFLVPIETLPNFLQPISSIVPLTYGIIVLKGIMLKGHGLGELWFEFGMIAAFCLAALALALLTVKEYDE